MRAPKILVQKDSEGEWYVSYRAANGRIVSLSQGYNSKRSAMRAVLALYKIIHNGFWEFPK